MSDSHRAARLTRRDVARLGVATLGTGALVLSPPDAPPAQSSPDLARLSAATTYTVGDFVIMVSGAANPTLTITRLAAPDHVLWQSRSTGGFLAAAVGQADIQENRAPASGFKIRDTIVERFDEQTVTGVTHDDTVLSLHGTLSGNGKIVDYTMGWEAGAGHLRFTVNLTGAAAAACNRIMLRYASSPDERFFGFGQQLTYFDQKGRNLPILVQEHGVGRGLPVISQLVALRFGEGSVGSWDTTEVSVPHYITTHRRSLCLDTSEYAVFDLSQDDQVELTLFANDMTGRVLDGETPLELIENYTAGSGRMRPLPDWMGDGVVVAVQGGTDRALQKLETLVEAGVPVSAFWIQDWVGVRQTPAGSQLWWNWQLDEQHYPNWHDLVSALQERLGARMLVYINPFLANQPGHDQMYQQALQAGYLVRTRTGEPYMIANAGFSVALVDLSNPAAFGWLKEIIKTELIAHAGASGWMADFGEALPFDAVLHGGADPAVWHNRYPEEWQRLNREAIDEAGRGEEIVFFTRSGYSRTPGLTTLCWLGDQLQSWDGDDGIKTAVVGALSGGISGFSLVHSDTGGFGSVSVPLPGGHKLPLVARSKELLLRWMELSALSPVFRTHEGIDPAVAWQFDSDAETLQAFRRCAGIYSAWAPYRKELIAEAAATGHPIMRHPFLHYPDDPETHGLRYQYLLGADIMVAPVLDPGRDTVRLYLPAGSWTHIWTGETYGPDASWVEVPAPLGQPAVLYRDDSHVGQAFVGALGDAGLLPG